MMCLISAHLQERQIAQYIIYVTKCAVLLFHLSLDKGLFALHTSGCLKLLLYAFIHQSINLQVVHFISCIYDI